jgi:nitroimidazol reductase NimA-like FMN-containing flavoprotein (pyridoxamine 5'-phosphate oxidase superfamily)
MFRNMRRKKQILKKEKINEIMKKNTNGILSCTGDEGYPYGVPVSFVYFNEKIYFHSAKSGHKIDSIKNNSKVSFTVVDKDQIVSEEYTSYFRSVIAFGKARLVEGEEWYEGFKELVEKYSGDQPEEAKIKEIKECTRSLIIAIDVEHITGKEAIELVKK